MLVKFFHHHYAYDIKANMTNTEIFAHSVTTKMTRDTYVWKVFHTNKYANISRYVPLWTWPGLDDNNFKIDAE